MKNIIKILLFILFLIFCIALDFVCSKYLNNTPFISTKTKEGNNTIYKSLLYDVYYCENETGELIRNFEPKNSDFACPVVEIKKYNYKINEIVTDVYAEALETFYEDDEYICTYNVIKSSLVKVEFDNGEVYTIKEVLENKLIDIEELIEQGIPCVRKTNETN